MSDARRRLVIFMIIVFIVILLTIIYEPVIKNSVLARKYTAPIWSVHFDKLSKPKTTGSAKVLNNPRLSATYIGDYKVNLARPGDSVTYEFDIVNDGTFDAKVAHYNEVSRLCNINYGFSHCDWNGNGYDDEDDIRKIGNNITYTLKYVDTNRSVRIGDELRRKSRVRVALTVKYNDNTREVPKGNVMLDGLYKVIIYVQK